MWNIFEILSLDQLRSVKIISERLKVELAEEKQSICVLFLG